MTREWPACIAIDPGTGKVGLCLFRADATVMLRRVLPVAELAGFLAQHPGVPLVLGEGTGQLRLPAGHPMIHIDEAHSTQEGRQLWRRAYPLLAFLELFGYNPPSDGYAAEVIGRRALAAGLIPSLNRDPVP